MAAWLEELRLLKEQSSPSQMSGTSDAVNRILAIETAIDAADEWDGGYDITREQIIRDALEKLPSAQPLVIHCTDCEGWLKRQSVLGFTVSKLPSVQPEQQWIPVNSEIKPKHRKRYLVSYSSGVTISEYRGYVVDKDSTIMYWANPKTPKYAIKTVKAWMPLPKPYGGDTND